MDHIKSIEGTIKFYGSSTLHDDWRSYSVIEIGGEHLANIAIDDTLDNYFKRGFDSNLPITLWLANRNQSNKIQSIVAIRLADGSSYGIKYWGNPRIVDAIVSTLLIPVFGLGILGWIGILFFDDKRKEYKELRKNLQGMIEL